jgi:hypothetical protein
MKRAPYTEARGQPQSRSGRYRELSCPCWESSPGNYGPGTEADPKRNKRGAITPLPPSPSFHAQCCHGPVGTATGHGAGVRVPVGTIFSPLHVVQNGSGANPASCPKDTGASLTGSNAAGE